MPVAMYAALFFTVALLVTTAYFLMGSVPLLILRHDTPRDSQFVRGFFNIYYKAAMFTAAATSLSYGLAGRPAFAIGAAALVIVAAMLRATIIGKMDRFRAHIQTDDTDAIPGFRRTHVMAILINLIQLVVVVWSLTTLSL
jgi:hypothetical protein